MLGNKWSFVERGGYRQWLLLWHNFTAGWFTSWKLSPKYLKWAFYSLRAADGSDTHKSSYCASSGKWLISWPWKMQACLFSFFFYTIILYLTQQHFRLLYQIHSYTHRISSIWNMATLCFRIISLLTRATLLLIMKHIGLWISVPSVLHGAVCTSAYVRVLLSSPSRVPERCSWCGCGAVEQGSLWQFQVEDSINSLPLSQSISSFLVSEGFLLQKKGAKLCISIYPFIFHAVEDYK